MGCRSFTGSLLNATTFLSYCKNRDELIQAEKNGSIVSKSFIPRSELVEGELFLVRHLSSDGARAMKGQFTVLATTLTILKYVYCWYRHRVGALRKAFL